ncbi:MAG: hypothetical protein D4Q77_00165 [Methanothrix sp.]|nr:MAG: hypothetical protein D4Q77_00165 [Methanothrix sp.]
MLLLTAAVSAHPETVMLGRYNVSFDLGKTSYTTEIEELEEGGCISHLCWLKGEEVMLISLTDHLLPMEVSYGIIRESVQTFLIEADCREIQTHEVIIDEKPGVLGLGERPSGGILFCVIYWPDMHEADDGTDRGRVDCTIASEGALAVTENLLNTIHVEMPQEG